MPRRLDNDQQSLFPTDLRDLAESIGLNWWAAKKLYDDKWLSFDPEINTINSSSQEAEFVFLGTLVAAGCDPRMLRRLLETLEKPYCYKLSGMYYDWSDRCWKDHDSPRRAVAKIVSEFADAGDANSLEVLKELIQEAIKRLNDVCEDGDVSQDTEKFNLTDEDLLAIEIAKNVANRFLEHPDITPEQKVGIGNALYALERLPVVTPGSHTEFGIVYRAGDKDFSEMRYIDFTVSEYKFKISRGGSVYDSSVGSDSFSEPGWIVEVGGGRNAECDLYELESLIDEYLNLGAKITVSDESKIEIEQDTKTEIMPPDIKQELINSLRSRYDDIVDSYEFSLRGLIAVLEGPQYNDKQMIVRDLNGNIVEYQLFYTTPPESWERLWGRQCSYKVDPLTLRAKLFGDAVMS